MYHFSFNFDYGDHWCAKVQNTYTIKSKSLVEPALHTMYLYLCTKLPQKQSGPSGITLH